MNMSNCALIGFSMNVEPSESFLEMIARLIRQGVKCYLVSDHEEELPCKRFPDLPLLSCKRVQEDNQFFYLVTYTNCREDFMRKKNNGLNIELI